MRVSTAQHVLQKRRGRAMALERIRLPAASEGGGGGGGDAAAISSALSRRRSGRPVAKQLQAASSSSSGRASSIPASAPRSGARPAGRVSEGLFNAPHTPWERVPHLEASGLSVGPTNLFVAIQTCANLARTVHGNARCHPRRHVRLRLAMVVAPHAPVHAHGAARRPDRRARRRALEQSVPKTPP